MKKFRLFFNVFLAACLLAGLVWSLQPILHARAATITVNSNGDEGADDGACTLREAIIAANGIASVDCGVGDSGADTIIFSSANPSYSILLGSALPAISEDLTIEGRYFIDDPSSRVVIDGAGQYRVLVVNSGVTVNITGITIQNGKADTDLALVKSGGAIINLGTLTVSNSTFITNTAAGGGGAILNTGTLTILGSTFNGNSSDNGGGIYNDSAAPLIVSNSTFYNNSAGTDGGAIDSFGTMTLANSTIFSNTAPSGHGGGINADNPNFYNTIVGSNTGGDCALYMTVNVDSHNLDSDGSCGEAATNAALNLSPLQDNGGPTWTMALMAASPAINTGDNAVCAADPVNSKDQRGYDRTSDGGTGTVCDIGAYELVDTVEPDTSISSQPSNPSNSASASFEFSGTDADSGVKSYECDLDGSGFTACTSPKDYTSLADGSHTFQVRAIDYVGNVDSIPASYTWTIDTSVPYTEINSQPDNPSNSASASFLVGGVDSGTGIVKYECWLDSGDFAVCTRPQDYNSLSDGEHTFQVRAIDAAGNVDATPASYTWTVDATPPDTQILTNPANPSNSASASFTFSGNDGNGTGVANFECSLDSSNFAACTSPQDYTGLADDNHTFQVRAIDAVGNVDATPASHTWTISLCAGDAIAVTTDADDGAGSLRQAIVDICPDGAITFNGDYTITLASTLEVDKSMTLDGSGHKVKLSGEGFRRLMYLYNSNNSTIQIEVNIQALTFADGLADGTGGGIYSEDVVLTVNNSTFSGNSATQAGGGIRVTANGTLTVTNSTFTTNSATVTGGGAIYNEGRAVVINSTFWDNQGKFGAGIYNRGVLTVTNSTLFANDTGIYSDDNLGPAQTTLQNTINANIGADCDIRGSEAFLIAEADTIASDATCASARVVADANLRLAPLADNGGNTQTMALWTGSPAIDTADAKFCPATDQRGHARPQNFGCDVGAYEGYYYKVSLPLAIRNK